MPSGDKQVLDNVLQICSDALEISKPVDPIKEPQMYSKTLLELKTPESRIKQALECINFIVKNTKNLKSYPKATPQINHHVSKDRILFYLNSMRFCDRKELLSVRFADLRDFCNGLDPISLEALSAAEVQHTPLLRWVCGYCGDTFFDPNAHKEHVGCFPPELEAVMPKKPNREWVALSEKLGWSAFDDPFHQMFPTHSIAERNQLLDSIHRVFLLLLSQRVLAASHVKKIVEMATTPLYSIPLKDIDVMVKDAAKSNECIRYSSGIQLSQTLDFLEAIKKLCHENRTTQEKLEDPFFLDPNQVAFLMDILHNEESSPQIYNVARDAKSLFSWLYESTADEDHMVTRNKRLSKYRKSVDELQVQFSFLCRLCEDKQKFLNACENLKRLCLGELERDKKELAVMESSQNIEHVISDIANNSNVVIKNKLEQLSLQILDSDARIMSSRSTTRKLTRKLGHLAVHDCETVLMQLVKSFLKFKLEDRIDREEKEKSEANSVRLPKANYQKETCVEPPLRGKSSLDDPVKEKREPVLEVGVVPVEESEQEHVSDDLRIELEVENVPNNVQFEPPVIESEELAPPTMSNEVFVPPLNGEEAQGDYFCPNCRAMSAKCTAIYLNT